jgi:hypothetical protein
LSLFLPALALLVGNVVWAQIPADDPPQPLASLKTVPVPEPPNLAEFVSDRATAILLGKALFGDMQVGSDGVQSCASCHFHAGADNRRKNQLGPGLLAQDTAFQIGGPNYTLEPHDFPFTKHTDENEPSLILSDTNDVVSSQGVFNAKFLDVTPPSPTDACDGVADTEFHVGGINTRRVEPRNAPTVFNAVFNFRNFWDGRANQNFNGVNPFGQRDENAHVWKTNASGGVEQVSIVIPLGSLASQAVGPRAATSRCRVPVASSPRSEGSCLLRASCRWACSSWTRATVCSSRTPAGQGLQEASRFRTRNSCEGRQEPPRSL